jgi:hypothetical protein
MKDLKLIKKGFMLFVLFFCQAGDRLSGARVSEVGCNERESLVRTDNWNRTRSGDAFNWQHL